MQCLVESPHSHTIVIFVHWVGLVLSISKPAMPKQQRTLRQGRKVKFEKEWEWVHNSYEPKIHRLNILTQLILEMAYKLVPKSTNLNS